MEIFGDDELLTVEKRNNHRDSDSACIIKGMKERGGE